MPGIERCCFILKITGVIILACAKMSSQLEQQFCSFLTLFAGDIKDLLPFTVFYIIVN